MPDDQNESQDTEPMPDIQIPSEQALEQRPIPFIGDELAAALTTGGSIYISLPGMCSALGLNTQAQFRRMLRTPTLAKGLRVIPLQTRGGVQQINCLRVDKIALWLAGIEPTRIRPRFRAKVEAYQEELAPVATEVFMRVMGIQAGQLVPTSADLQHAGQIEQIVEQIDTLSGVVTLMREHLAALLSLPGQVQGLSAQLGDAVAMLESLAQRQDAAEAQLADTGAQLAAVDARTQRLTPAHTRQVQEMVDRMVRETRQLPAPLTYATIYGRLKHRFRVGSYKEAADNRFDELMVYLREELRRAMGGEAPEQGSLF